MGSTTIFRHRALNWTRHKAQAMRCSSDLYFVTDHMQDRGIGRAARAAGQFEPEPEQENQSPDLQQRARQAVARPKRQAYPYLPPPSAPLFDTTNVQETGRLRQRMIARSASVQTDRSEIRTRSCCRATRGLFRWIVEHGAQIRKLLLIAFRILAGASQRIPSAGAYAAAAAFFFQNTDVEQLLNYAAAPSLLWTGSSAITTSATGIITD